MYEAATGPQNIGEVLDSGFRLFKASFSSIWGFGFLMGIAAIPLNLVNASVATADPANFGGLLGMMFLALIFYGIVTLILFGALCARIGGIADNEPISIGESLNVGVRRSPALLGAGIVAMIGVVIGILLLVIPGLWLMVVWFFCWYAVVLDDKGPIESLKYSFALVRGHWWRTAIILTICGIIVSVIYLLLGLVVALLVGFGTITAEDINSTMTLIENVITPLMQILLVPLMYSLFIALYYDAKLRHEGSDLEERIASSTE